MPASLACKHRLTRVRPATAPRAPRLRGLRTPQRAGDGPPRHAATTRWPHCHPCGGGVNASIVAAASGRPLASATTASAPALGTALMTALGTIAAALLATARRTTASAALRSAPRRTTASAALRSAPRRTTAASATLLCAGRTAAGIARWRTALRPTTRVARRSAAFVTRWRTTLGTPPRVARRRTTRWPATRVARRSAAFVTRWRTTLGTPPRVNRRRTARWPATRVTRRTPTRVPRRRPPVRRRVPGARSRRRRRRMTRPARLLPVPRLAAIVVAPIIVERKREDRQAERGAVVQRHVVALIRRTEPRRIHPAAQIRRGDIAPLVVAEAAHHRHRKAARELRDDRVVGRRARAHVGPAVRIGLRLRTGEAGQSQQARRHGKTDHELSFHSFSFFDGRIGTTPAGLPPLPIYRRCARFMTCERARARIEAVMHRRCTPPAPFDARTAHASGGPARQHLVTTRPNSRVVRASARRAAGRSSAA